MFGLRAHSASLSPAINAAGSAEEAQPAPTPWRALDDWFARPRSPRSVVIGLSLYLALAANWPLWNELARIGGAPSVYLPLIALMSLLLVCCMVAVLSFTAWTRWMEPLWFGVVVLGAVV